jgi:hypothetical protein
MNEPVFMLTTRDNPYNPFTNFDEWYVWDISHGYNTSAYLARIAKDSPELSAAQSQRAVNDAIDEIISYNLTGNYLKVSKEDYNDWHPSDETTYGAIPIKE